MLVIHTDASTVLAWWHNERKNYNVIQLHDGSWHNGPVLLSSAIAITLIMLLVLCVLCVLPHNQVLCLLLKGHCGIFNAGNNLSVCCPQQRSGRQVGVSRGIDFKELKNGLSPYLIQELNPWPLDLQSSTHSQPTTNSHPGHVKDPTSYLSVREVLVSSGIKTHRYYIKSAK